jgi:hypothetical protein
MSHIILFIWSDADLSLEPAPKSLLPMDTRTAYATGRRKAGRASVKKKDGNVLLIAKPRCWLERGLLGGISWSMLTGYCLVLFRKSPDPFRGLTWQTRMLFILAQTPAELLMCCGKAKKKLSIYPSFGSTGQVVCDDLRRWHQNPDS